MSLKQEIETWVQALDHYDNHDFEGALRVFANISDTSKICFNCGVIYATLGEHEKAVECYQRAVGLDQYLAIAYFQEGVSNFLLGDFEEALANFNDTLLYLRGNTSIDYEQLGLRFRLYSCEVLFNRGLCYTYLQQMGPGMQDLEYAVKEKVTPDHDVIDDAIRERAEGYTVFSIPVGVLYRPNEAKVKNLKTKDYLGKARLVAASDRTTTPAYEIQRTQSALDNRPPDSLYATATHVHKNIMSSRTRQQSEPPLQRNLFPPTPPPDADKASMNSSSSGSVRAARPPRLDLDRPGAHLSTGSGGMSTRGSTAQQLQQVAKEKPRIGTIRTASEPRGQTRGYSSERFGEYRSPPQGQQAGVARRGEPPRGYEHRRGMSDTYASGNGYPTEDATYAGYAGYARPTMVVVGNGGSRRGVERYIEEEDEFESSGGCDEDGFEMLDGSRRRTRSPHRSSRRGNSRRPEVRKFRVKVHAAEDTRYIIIGSAIEFGEFEARIRDKFGFRCLLKIRMQDEGDMITMVDQEDLDLLMGSARDIARREGSEMGKMEIWVEERTMI